MTQKFTASALLIAAASALTLLRAQEIVVAVEDRRARLMKKVNAGSVAELVKLLAGRVSPGS